MKHLLTTFFMICFSLTTVVAQEITDDKTMQEKTISKEDKNAKEAKKEADLQEAFKLADFNTNDQKLVRASNEARAANKKELKADPSLSEEDIKVKSKEFRTAEDDVLKEKIGKEKYKKFKDIQKEQKGESK